MVVEADAPDRYQRLAAVVQIGRVLRHMHALPQALPVVDDLIGLSRLHAAQVIHHGVGPPAAIGSFTAMIEHGVGRAHGARVVEPADEALNECAVDPILAHPLEMPVNGVGVERTEDLGRLAIGELKPRSKPFGRP